MDEKQMVIDSTGVVVEELDLSPESVIQVARLPLIKERMRDVNAAIVERVSVLDSMECTEENRKEVKSALAEMRAELKAWEDQRKTVKAKINSPYEDFNKSYEENIGQPYKKAIAAASAKLESVENSLKQRMAAKVEKFCYELMRTMGVSTEIVNFGQLGIKINLSTSYAAYQNQVSEKIGQIAADLEVISKMPDAAEIMVEYKRNRNLAKAQATVMDRKEAIRRAEEQKRIEDAERAERQKKALEAQMAARQAEQENAAEQSQAPVAVPVKAPVQVPEAVPTEPQKTAGLTFRVTGPKDKMIEFRDLLKTYCAEHGLDVQGLKKTKIADMQEGMNYYG